MATKAEMLIEANRRGLLKGEHKSNFDEAVRRGLIKLPASEQPGQNLPTQMSTPEMMREHAERALTTVQYPGAESGFGAVGAGFRRGMEGIGEGLAQRYYDVVDFFGGDTDEKRRRLEISRKIQQQKFEPTQEEYPVTSTVGEIGGMVAGFPVPAATIPKAIGAGGLFGATQYLESGEGAGTFAANIAMDAAAGGLGQAAAPYIQKGFNKAQSLFSGIYKRATGADPRPSMFTESGGLSAEGRKVMTDLGITEDEFGRIYQSLDQNLNPTQAARQQRATEQGIPLTQGQITQDFAQQEAEQTLRSGLGREAVAARAFEEGQQEAIGEATERFARQFGDIDVDRGLRGQSVQDALRTIQKEDKAVIRGLYDKAAQTEGAAIPLQNEVIVDTAYDALMGRPVDKPVVDSVERVLAKYGLIGEATGKKGRFTSVVTDDGKNINVTGDIEPLSLKNSEDFRKALNQILPSDQTGAVSGIVRQLDNQVANVVDSMPAGSPRQQAYEAARTAARAEKETFGQKDIINNLVGFKKNAQTDLIDPGLVMDQIYQGKKGLGNLNKVKNVLMRNPTNKSVDAWKSIQAQGVSDIFSQAYNPADGAFSGARLESAIKRFGNGDMKQGERKLKALLGDRYTEFNNLRRSIGDATIPIKGTTNNSGTAYKLLNFMTRVGTVGQFGAEAALSVAGKAKDAATARSTLRKIQNPTAERVQRVIRDNDEFIDAFMGLGIQRAMQEER